MKKNKSKSVTTQAAELASKNKFSEAARLLSVWLKSNPDDFNALFLLGSALLGLNQVENSLVYLLRAQKINPNNAKLLNNIGSAYNRLRDMANAIEYFKKSIASEPNFAQAHYNMGNAFMNTDKWSEAIASFSNAIELKNNYPEAYSNLCLCLINIKAYNDAINVSDIYLNQFGLNPKIIVNKCRAIYAKGLKANSIQALEEYLTQISESYELHTVLADLCMSTKQYEKAIKHFSRSIELNPIEYTNFNNLGILFMETGRQDLAIEAYTKSSELNPVSPIPHQNIAAIFNQRKEYASSLNYLEKALKLDPNADYIKGMIAHAKIYTCNWAGLDDCIQEIINETPHNNKISNPFPPIAYIDNQILLTKISSDWVKNKCPTSKFFPEIKINKHGGKIRLGYFSADLHTHATALLIAGLLEAHDRSKFELIAFSFGPDSKDPLTTRVRAAFDRFIDVRSLSDRAITALARELCIDIAIDLKGFTQDSRTGIFAERAAPIQINYLGFPGSMGASYIDYIVADQYIIPAELEHCYTEKVVRLPHCYQPNDNLRSISLTKQTRAEHNLPENALVLCSFNNNYKITPSVFEIWMRILRNFPHSVLWLLKDTPAAESNLRREASLRGIDSNRLIFASRLNSEEHLARHTLADLFLDTYPCNAHTTASDALWAGLPIVTCSGNSFASRVAGSLLNTIGLGELITNNLHDYEGKIIEVISNPNKLMEIKKKLGINKLKSPLYDTAKYTRDWESLLLNLYDNQFTK